MKLPRKKQKYVELWIDDDGDLFVFYPDATTEYSFAKRWSPRSLSVNFPYFTRQYKFERYPEHFVYELKD